MKRLLQFLVINFLLLGAFWSHYCQHHSEFGHQHRVGCLVGHFGGEKSGGVGLLIRRDWQLEDRVFYIEIVYYFDTFMVVPPQGPAYLERAPPGDTIV